MSSEIGNETCGRAKEIKRETTFTIQNAFKSIEELLRPVLNSPNFHNIFLVISNISLLDKGLIYSVASLRS